MDKVKNEHEYELAYFLTPDVAEEKLGLEIDEIRKIISENGGEMVDSGTPKKRWLAYPIKKQTQGYFGVIYFEAGKENIDKIKKALPFNKNVLRFLISNKSSENKKPAIAAAPEAKAPSFDQKLESILNR